MPNILSVDTLIPNAKRAMTFEINVKLNSYIGTVILSKLKIIIFAQLTYKLLADVHFEFIN